ncbi:MAG: hypothetical protein P8H61_11910, partial [Ilumatobacter sp.]|nr:hypothetical protein [Ilumatobacter sp.]
MRWTGSRRCVAALGAAALTVAACADTDPTSRTPPSAGESDANAIVVSVPPTDRASETTVVVDSDAAPTTDGALAAPVVTTDDPETRATSVTSVVDATLLEGFATDDPTFEVEPLRPFEVRVAEDAPPSGPGLDDAGSGQPTGWAAFDANLDAALLRNGNSAASVAVLIGG